jgi:hypothetical protein
MASVMRPAARQRRTLSSFFGSSAIFNPFVEKR